MNQELHCRVHNSPLPVPVLNHMNETNMSAYQFYNFYIPTYTYGCWPSTLTEKCSDMKVVTMELTCTCDIADVWTIKVRPCRWVCWRCRRIATETTHYTTFHWQSTQLLWTAEHIAPHSGVGSTGVRCWQYRLLAVCIAPTAGGEKTLTLCFTLVSVLFVEILFGKINFPCLSPSRSLSVCLYRVVSLCFIRHFEQPEFTASSRNAIIFLIDISNYKENKLDIFRL